MSVTKYYDEDIDMVVHEMDWDKKELDAVLVAGLPYAVRSSKYPRYPSHSPTNNTSNTHKHPRTPITRPPNHKPHHQLLRPQNSSQVLQHTPQKSPQIPTLPARNPHHRSGTHNLTHRLAPLHNLALHARQSPSPRLHAASPLGRAHARPQSRVLPVLFSIGAQIREIPAPHHFQGSPHGPLQRVTPVASFAAHGAAHGHVAFQQRLLSVEKGRGAGGAGSV
ncbi:hypothetical protein EJ04DRAFT_129948 [Polyplosphaeria fusca]|uniref:Uncharacterized protein n=1 Tax=Polyplosphaeria fusca TaxID=682080 RepID=A0A9P4R0E6_9PLEO|nr:hypothetical protein EJ04DRAFT_129948 [Polyplosphaeria fusca]